MPTAMVVLMGSIACVVPEHTSIHSSRMCRVLGFISHKCHRFIKQSRKKNKSREPVSGVSELDTVSWRRWRCGCHGSKGEVASSSPYLFSAGLTIRAWRLPLPGPDVAVSDSCRDVHSFCFFFFLFFLILNICVLQYSSTLCGLWNCAHKAPPWFHIRSLFTICYSKPNIPRSHWTCQKSG